MFFTFNSKKLTVVGGLLVILFVGTYFALFLNNRYKIGEGFDLHVRNIGEEISYWWDNKVFGTGGSAFINYSESDGEARSVPVLVYHGLPDEGAGNNPFSAGKFAEQMTTLSRAGWKTITLEEFKKFIRGDVELPEKVFLLTFDDGRKDTFYPSDPILDDLGMNAVMFAITKKSISPTAEQSTYYVSPYELGVMEKSDHWEVESHGRDSHEWYYVNNDQGVGHFYSNLLWLSDEGRLETKEEFRERISYDFRNAKIDLETTLNKEVSAFAYPFGDYGQESVNYSGVEDVVKEEVKKSYDLVFHQVWNSHGETFNYPSETEVMMRRIEPPGDWDGEYLLSILESGISKDLPFEQSSFGSEWREVWGNALSGNALALEATEKTSGATTVLNGSWWWSDYTFNTDVSWIGGSNLVLIGRRENDSNYFGCNFGQNKVYLKTVVNGSSRNLMEADYVLPVREGGVRLGMYAKGNDIGCLVDNKVVLEGIGINHRIANGGIGLEIWDKNNGVAEAVFDNVEVLER